MSTFSGTNSLSFGDKGCHVASAYVGGDERPPAISFVFDRWRRFLQANVGEFLQRNCFAV